MLAWLRYLIGWVRPEATRRWDPVDRGWPPDFREPAFWRDYCDVRRLRGSYPALANLRLELCVTAQHALTLTLDSALHDVDLGLLVRGQKQPHQLAWWDSGTWHPDLFRWPELLAICGALSSRSAHYAHPGIPVLLLFRFAPVTDGDDVSAIRGILEQAFETLELFDEGEIERMIDRCVRERDEDVVWVGSPGTYNLVGEGVHSLRNGCDPEFPATEFAAMLAALPKG